MSYEPDKILRHLARQQKLYWFEWLFRSRWLDKQYFDSNPAFFTALQQIQHIESIIHFNADSSNPESNEDQLEPDEELLDTDDEEPEETDELGEIEDFQDFQYFQDLEDSTFRLKIEYTQEFKKIRASTPFIVLSGETGFLILTPMRYWSYLGDQYSTGETNKIRIRNFFYEHKSVSPSSSDEILLERWKYATKSGDRDWRYKDNFNIYLVHRYGLTLLLQNESKWEFELHPVLLTPA